MCLTDSLFNFLIEKAIPIFKLITLKIKMFTHYKKLMKYGFFLCVCLLFGLKKKKKFLL